MTKITLEITEDQKGRIKVKQVAENINATLLEHQVGQAYVAAMELVSSFAEKDTDWFNADHMSVN